GGYGADVVDPEPIQVDNPLVGLDRVVLTPHIGSRTYESVGRQAMMATQNLIQVLNGKPALAQANEV
ncbi:MAG: 3-phosphoglycerate dehydrogenase, partial [Candidatus Omnitrophica bacterium]|nr:3-phosphoglycerate dehydrogenase [Candidatus Omnitrophota bacterium]